MSLFMRLALAGLLFLVPGLAAAAGGHGAAPSEHAPPAAAPPPPPAPPKPVYKSDVEAYCANVADAAADARFAWQARTLTDLQKEIDARLLELELKREEYEEWLARRDRFLKQAEDGVVAIYAKMRPEAAAAQIGAMQEEAAAALLSKLSSRAASAILNEMEPKRAARLTAAMTGMPTPDEEEDAS
jgi:flagellar motility protein MotE (MotC chaperone)